MKNNNQGDKVFTTAVRIVFISSFFLLFIPQLSAQKKKMQSTARVLFGVGVLEASDKFEGTTTYQMSGNKVFSQLSGVNALGNLLLGTDTPTFKTFLNLEKHVLKNGDFEFSVLFKVQANNEQFAKVMKGESLIFLLDDDRLELTTEGSYNSDFDVEVSGVSSETNARYPISQNQLKKLNNSKKVEFRIILESYKSGAAEERDKNQQHLDGKFNKKNKRVWVEFYDDYIISNQ